MPVAGEHASPQVHLVRNVQIAISPSAPTRDTLTTLTTMQEEAPSSLQHRIEPRFVFIPKFFLWCGIGKRKRLNMIVRRMDFDSSRRKHWHLAMCRRATSRDQLVNYVHETTENFRNTELTRWDHTTCLQLAEINWAWKIGRQTWAYLAATTADVNGTASW